jgi:hypothetical protein
VADTQGKIFSLIREQFADAVFHDDYRTDDLRSYNLRTIVDIGSCLYQVNSFVYFEALSLSNSRPNNKARFFRKLFAR